MLAIKVASKKGRRLGSVSQSARQALQQQSRLDSAASGLSNCEFVLYSSVDHTVQLSWTGPSTADAAALSKLPPLDLAFSLSNRRHMHAVTERTSNAVACITCCCYACRWS